MFSEEQGVKNVETHPGSIVTDNHILRRHYGSHAWPCPDPPRLALPPCSKPTLTHPRNTTSTSGRRQVLLIRHLLDRKSIIHPLCVLHFCHNVPSSWNCHQPCTTKTIAFLLVFFFLPPMSSLLCSALIRSTNRNSQCFQTLLFLRLDVRNLVCCKLCCTSLHASDSSSSRRRSIPGHHPLPADART